MTKPSQARAATIIWKEMFPFAKQRFSAYPKNQARIIVP